MSSRRSVSARRMLQGAAHSFLVWVGLAMPSASFSCPSKSAAQKKEHVEHALHHASSYSTLLLAVSP